MLRKDRRPYPVAADTICDVHGNGTHLRSERGGLVVGEIEGDIRAWWIEESGQNGETYCMEISGENEMMVIADESAVRNRESPHDKKRDYPHASAAPAPTRIGP